MSKAAVWTVLVFACLVFWLGIGVLAHRVLTAGAAGR